MDNPETLANDILIYLKTKLSRKIEDYIYKEAFLYIVFLTLSNVYSDSIMQIKMIDT